MVSKVMRLVLFAVASATVLGVVLFFPHVLEGGRPTASDGHGDGARRPLTPKPETKPAGEDGDPAAEVFNMASPVTCPTKRWSKAQLKQHVEPSSDLLILVHGMVLNVTTFLPNHPGGQALMAGAGGEDAGVQFSHYHQPTTTGLFSNMCVGKLDGAP